MWVQGGKKHENYTILYSFCLRKEEEKTFVLSFITVRNRENILKGKLIKRHNKQITENGSLMPDTHHFRIIIIDPDGAVLWQEGVDLSEQCPRLLVRATGKFVGYLHLPNVWSEERGKEGGSENNFEWVNV